MTNRKLLKEWTGKVVYECPTHGDYVADRLLKREQRICTADTGPLGDGPHPSPYSLLLGRLCECYGVTLNGNERVPWVHDECFGTRPLGLVERGHLVRYANR